MSVQAIGAALKIQGVSSSAKLLLLVLANYADDKMRCWPSQSTLARDTCLSQRHVLRLLGSLENEGIIRRQLRTRPNGSRSTDMIHLLLHADTMSRGVGTRSLRGGDTVSPPTTLEPSSEPSDRNIANALSPPATMKAFEAAWAAYPHHPKRSKRKAALRNWNRLSEREQTDLPAAVLKYRREHPDLDLDYGAPAMDRWLADGGYECWLPGYVDGLDENETGQVDEDIPY